LNLKNIFQASRFLHKIHPYPIIIALAKDESDAALLRKITTQVECYDSRDRRLYLRNRTEAARTKV